jgi:ribosomal protein S18 acetylase RimI-like enzyme
MTPIVDTDGWALDRATSTDLASLRAWLDTADAVRTWGGPNFRYPYTTETFVEDCHWPEMDSFCLRDPDGRLAAFGQLYDRDGRINLARLIAKPSMRGRGVGRRLVGLLMVAGARLLDLDEYSLYVYRDNEAALSCYRAMGFEIADCPLEGPLAEECYFLTRLVEARFRQTAG